MVDWVQPKLWTHGAVVLLKAISTIEEWQSLYELTKKQLEILGGALSKRW